MKVCSCDHCGKILERSHLVLRQNVEADNDGVIIVCHAPEMNSDFCGLPCLTGWAMSQAKKWGYINRIPQPKP